MKYEPYPWQRKMHRSPAKVKWVHAGRRSGKTRSALAEALELVGRASRTPVTLPSGLEVSAQEAGLEPEIHVWTVAPTDAQMIQIWHEMKAFIPEGLPYDWSRQGNRGGGRGNRSGAWKEDQFHVRLLLPSGYRRKVFWELKTANNPEGLQTVGLDFLHVTEAQDIKEAAWHKVRPTLSSPFRFGRAIIEGIPPMSSMDWFARYFKSASRDPNERREAFRATFRDNPNLTSAQRTEIEEDQANMPEHVWRRLYLAEQPEGRGQFFRRINDAAGRDGCVDLAAPVPGRQYVAGLDLGRTHDPTVMIVKDRQSRVSVSVVELLRSDWNLQQETIKGLVRHWGVQEVYMDSTGLGGMFAEDVLYRELLAEDVPVIGYNFTPQKKYQLFVDYAISLERGTVSFPGEWTKLISQLEDMSHRETANRGHHFYTASGSHDDWVDAETLALMACEPAREMGEEYRIIEPVSGIPPLRNGAGAHSMSSGFMDDLLRGIQAGRRPDGPVPDLVVDGGVVYLEEE